MTVVVHAKPFSQNRTLLLEFSLPQIIAVCYRRLLRPQSPDRRLREPTNDRLRYQSGEIDYDGGISKCGDAMLRTMLYEAAQSMLTHSKKWSWLKAWAMRVAQRRGMRRATVALARRIAVILHRIWIDGTDFRFSNSAAKRA